MKEKRRDNKGRILHTGESQRTDGKYLYKYVDAFGNTKYVYAWRLTPTDPTPKGKREKPSLRELEQQIRRDIEDGIDSTGKKMTLCQLYAKQNAQRANVKKSTQKQREYITDYINGTNIEASDLYPIKEFIQHLKFQKLLDRYDDLYSMDMFGESIEGHKYRTPYQVVKMINPNSKEDMELLREVLRNNHFDDEDE